MHAVHTFQKQFTIHNLYDGIFFLVHLPSFFFLHFHSDSFLVFQHGKLNINVTECWMWNGCFSFFSILCIVLWHVFSVAISLPFFPFPISYLKRLSVHTNFRFRSLNCIQNLAIDKWYQFYWKNWLLSIVPYDCHWKRLLNSVLLLNSIKIQVTTPVNFIGNAIADAVREITHTHYSHSHEPVDEYM